jgi:hypothetical protein
MIRQGAGPTRPLGNALPTRPWLRAPDRLGPVRALVGRCSASAPASSGEIINGRDVKGRSPIGLRGARYLLPRTVSEG